MGLYKWNIYVTDCMNFGIYRCWAQAKKNKDATITQKITST